MESVSIGLLESPMKVRQVLRGIPERRENPEQPLPPQVLKATWGTEARRETLELPERPVPLVLREKWEVPERREQPGQREIREILDLVDYLETMERMGRMVLKEIPEILDLPVLREKPGLPVLAEVPEVVERKSILTTRPPE